MSSIIDNHPNNILGTYRFTILHHDKLSFYSIGDNDSGACGCLPKWNVIGGPRRYGKIIKLTKMPMVTFKFEQDEYTKLISNVIFAHYY